jgi:hypothetical protein
VKEYSRLSLKKTASTLANLVEVDYMEFEVINLRNRALQIKIMGSGTSTKI